MSIEDRFKSKPQTKENSVSINGIEGVTVEQCSDAIYVISGQRPKKTRQIRLIITKQLQIDENDYKQLTNK